MFKRPILAEVGMGNMVKGRLLRLGRVIKGRLVKGRKAINTHERLMARRQVVPMPLVE
jgi:hypothetical protein